MTINIPTVLSNTDIINLAPAAGATRPVAGVSDRYSFVSTLNVIDTLRDDGWLPVAASQANVRKATPQGFQKHFIRLARPEFFMENERIDLLLYNSHNRGCSFKLMAGIWKFVCSNGLVVGTEYASFNHKHVGFDSGLFLESAQKVAGTAGDIAHKIDSMKAIELEPNEQGIYAAAAHQLVYGAEAVNAPIRPTQLIESRRYEDDGNDLWTVFNKTQENIIKGGLRGSITDDTGRRRRRTTRAVKSLDRSKDLNQALWSLTEKMEELKLNQ